jgi:ComF family protein
MNEIISKMSGWIVKPIVELLFPQDPLEEQAKEVIASIAKIKCDNGDMITKYPCPAYSFFEYKNDSVRAMIWRLKYRGDKTTAEIFAKRMYDQLCEELTEMAQWSNFINPILIAIPVSKHKLRLRGFNQSAAICKALAVIDENRFFNYNPNVLYKIKDTKSQAQVKDKKSRLENLKDSFTVKDKSLVENQNIILLDDVLTTGSTLTEATCTLKSVGAKNIIWVVVAH